MKKPEWTIENVITSLENNSCSECSYTCRTPFECNCKGCFYRDAVAKAVEYLKEYKKLDSLDAVAFTEDDNPLLTWQELRQMEGKPVWLERPEWKEWLLISEIDEYKCEIYLRDKWGNGASVNGRNIGYWRAYRKEKNENS
jgi:hypothetical protein